MEIQGVIFDLDGTLIDSMWVWENLCINWAKNKNLELTEEVIDKLRHTYLKESSQYIVDYYKLQYPPQKLLDEWEEMLRYFYANEVKLKEGAKEFLLKLKKNNIKTAIATSCFQPLCEAVLKNNGIYELFDGFAYSIDVGNNKSFPDVYLLAAGKMGVDPKKCVVIEDIYPALQGVRAANMKFIGMYEATSKDSEELLKAESDYYVVHFNDLYQLDIFLGL